MTKMILAGNFPKDEILLQISQQKLFFTDLLMYQLIEPKRGGIYVRKLDPKLQDADVETAVNVADVIIGIGDIGKLTKEKIKEKEFQRIEDRGSLDLSPVPYIIVEYGPEWLPDVLGMIGTLSLLNYNFRLTSQDASLDSILSLTKFRDHDAKMEIRLICRDGCTSKIKDIRNMCVRFLQNHLSYPEYCAQQIHSYQSEWKKNIHMLKKGSVIFLSCSRTTKILSDIQKDIISAFDNGRISELLTIPRQEVEEVVGILNHDTLEGKHFEALMDSGQAVIANKNDMIISFLGSRRCNMKCKYCFSDHTCEAKATMPNKIALEIVEMLTCGKENLNLHIDNNLGGEPLLDFTAVMARHNAAIALHKASGINTSFGLLTNGTLLRSDHIDWLKDHLPYIGFSLDGDKATHDKIRKDVNGEPTYERTVSGIKLLQMADWPVETGVSAVISKYNMDITELQSHFREELNIPNIVMKPVRAEERSDFSLTYDDLDDLKKGYGTFFRYLLDEGRKGNLKPLFTMLQPLDYAARFLIRVLLADRVIVKRCGSGEHIFSVNDDGSLYACDSFNGVEDMEIGNVEEGMHNHPDYNVPFVNDENPSFGCNRCWARYLCGGVCQYVQYLNKYEYNNVIKMECGLAMFLIESSICFWQEAKETWGEESMAKVKERIREIGITEYLDKNSFVYAPC